MILSLAFRNIWRRKFRTSVTIISILVSSLLYSSIGSASTAISISSIRAYTDYVGDFDILVTGTGDNLFFNASRYIKNLTEIKYVDVVSPRLIFNAYSPINETYLRLTVIGIDKQLDEGIGSFELLSGELDFGENGCLILDEIASSNNLNLGDTITLYYFNINGSVTSSKFTIKGIVKQHGKIPIDMKNVVFIPLEKAQEALGVSGLVNFLFIKLDPNIIDPFDLDSSVKRIVKVGEEIQEIMGFQFQVTLLKAQILRNVSNGIEFQKGLLNTFASMTILMAIILVVFTITMNLNERIREIGVLRALGLGKNRIFALFLTEALILGIIGSIIGATLGILLSDILFLTPILGRTRILRSYISGIVFNPYDLLISVSIGLLSAIIGGVYPALSAAKIEPAEALSPAARRAREIDIIEKKINPERPLMGIIYIGASMFLVFSLFMVIIPTLGTSNVPSILFLVIFLLFIIMLISIVFVLSGLFPAIIGFLKRLFKFSNRIPVILANINLLRRRKRTILAFFMITTAVSSLLLMGIIMDTQEKNIVASIKVSAGSDIIIYSQSGLPLNVTENISNIQGVIDVCPITYKVSVSVGDIVFWEKATVNLYGISPSGYVNASYIDEFTTKPRESFNRLNENMTIILSEGLAKKLGVKINDFIRLNLYQENLKLKVVGILPTAPGFSFTRFPHRASGSDVLVSLETFSEILKKEALATRILVKVKENYDVTDVANRLNELLSKSYDIQIITTTDYIERASETIQQLKTILSTLLNFAVFVAVLGLMASTMTTIREREWEIGVLRALGSSKTQIITIFVTETLILVLLGFISGLIAALIAAYELNYSNTLTSEIVIPISIPIDQSLITLLTVLIPAIILSIIVSYQATRKDIASTIRKAEEL